MERVEKTSNLNLIDLAAEFKVPDLGNKEIVFN